MHICKPGSGEGLELRGCCSASLAFTASYRVTERLCLKKLRVQRDRGRKLTSISVSAHVHMHTVHICTHAQIYFKSGKQYSDGDWLLPKTGPTWDVRKGHWKEELPSRKCIKATILPPDICRLNLASQMRKGLETREGWVELSFPIKQWQTCVL